MNPSREEALFALAVEKPGAERAAFLDSECSGDAQLRQRVEALLKAHDQTSGVLEEPPAAVSAKTFVITTAMVPAIARRNRGASATVSNRQSSLCENTMWP